MDSNWMQGTPAFLVDATRKCKTCVNWKFPAEGLPYGTKGECVLPLYDDSMMLMMFVYDEDDGQDSSGTLLTDPEHGCNEWVRGEKLREAGGTPEEIKGIVDSMVRRAQDRIGQGT